MPCIGSTTTPSTRRSCPHTVSTRAASWMPSTQIRLARAVRAVRFATFDRARGRDHRPLARGGGTTSVAGRPVDQERGGRSGKTRWRPCRSSRVTSRTSTRTTAPQNRWRVLDDDARARRGPRDLPLADDPRPSAPNGRGSRASWPRGARRRDRVSAGASRGCTATDRAGAAHDTPSARPRRPFHRTSVTVRGRVSPHGRRAARRALVSLTLVPCASATFTVWSSAWLAGAAAPDDVLDALGPVGAGPRRRRGGRRHRAHPLLSAPGTRPAPVTFLLAALRRAAPRGPGRVVLPAPGDPRGLPGPGPFSRAAMGAGEGCAVRRRGRRDRARP
jgi:hypothetical protein